MFYGADSEELLIVMVGILLVAYFLLFGLGIAGYIMNAIAIKRIASKRLISGSWLAWVPILNSWVLGRIADEYDEKNGIKRRWGVVLLLLSLITTGGILVSYVGMFSSGIDMAMQMESVSEGIGNMAGAFIGSYVLLLLAAIVASAKNGCDMVCLYKVFESTVPEKAIKYFLVSLLVPLGKSICLLRCRNQGYEKIIVTNPVSPANPDEAQAAASEATEDEESFAEETVEEVNVEETISEE